MSILEDIEALIRRRSQLTEQEIAQELFPDDPYQQRVNSSCRQLLKDGRVKRHGRGGVGEPFRYSIE